VPRGSRTSKHATQERQQNGKPSGNAVAETAWQTVLDSLKRLDEANDFDRRALKTKFLKLISEQEEAT